MHGRTSLDRNGIDGANVMIETSRHAVLGEEALGGGILELSNATNSRRARLHRTNHLVGFESILTLDIAIGLETNRHAREHKAARWKPGFLRKSARLHKESPNCLPELAC